MKQLTLFLTIMTSLTAHAQNACQQRFPHDDVPTELEEIVVYANRCRPSARNQEEKSVESAYVFSHLVTNWMYQREEIRRRLNRRLRSLDGIKGVTELTPQSCRDLLEGNLRDAPPEIQRCSRSVANLLQVASTSEAVNPNIASYFLFLKGLLAGETQLSAEDAGSWMENYYFHGDGSVQRRSCEAVPVGHQSGESLVKSLSGVRFALTEAIPRSGAAPADPAGIISNYFASHNRHEELEESGRLTDHTASRSNLSDDMLRAIGENYFMRHTTSLRDISRGECSGDHAPSELVARVKTIFNLPAIVTLTEADAFDRSSDIQSSNERRLQENLEMIVKLGGAAACSQLTGLLREYMQYTSRLAEAVVLRNDSEIQERIRSATGEFRNKKNDIMAEAYSASGEDAVAIVRDEIAARYDKECRDVGVGMATGLCASPEGLVDNRHLVSTALDQFGLPLCGSFPERVTKENTTGWPMAYNADVERRRKEAIERASSCYSEDCVGQTTVEGQMACLNRRRQRESSSANLYDDSPLFSGADYGANPFYTPGPKKLKSILAGASGDNAKSLSAVPVALQRSASVAGNAIQAIGSPASTAEIPFPSSSPSAPVTALPVVASGKEDDRVVDRGGDSDSESPRSRRRGRRSQVPNVALANDGTGGGSNGRAGRTGSILGAAGTENIVNSSAPANLPTTSMLGRNVTSIGRHTPKSTSQPLAPVAPIANVPRDVAQVSEPFEYKASAFNQALVDAHQARAASGRASVPTLVAGVDLSQESSMVSLPVPPAEITTVEGYQDYISERIDREVLARQGSMIVQLGDGGTLWKVELVNGEIVVNPVPPPQVAVARRFALDVLRNALNQAQTDVQ